MLNMLIEKSEEDYNIQRIDNSEGVAHGTAMIKYMILYWANTVQGICDNYYFSSF